jgi:hypothetical protein
MLERLGLEAGVTGLLSSLASSSSSLRVTVLFFLNSEGETLPLDVEKRRRLAGPAEETRLGKYGESGICTLFKEAGIRGVGEK